MVYLLATNKNKNHFFDPGTGNRRFVSPRVVAVFPRAVRNMNKNKLSAECGSNDVAGIPVRRTRRAPHVAVVVAVCNAMWPLVTHHPPRVALASLVDFREGLCARCSLATRWGKESREIRGK
jgi:hypothetical protein